MSTQAWSCSDSIEQNDSRRQMPRIVAQTAELKGSSTKASSEYSQMHISFLQSIHAQRPTLSYCRRTAAIRSDSLEQCLTWSRDHTRREPAHNPVVSARWEQDICSSVSMGPSLQSHSFVESNSTPSHSHHSHEERQQFSRLPLSYACLSSIDNCERDSEPPATDQNHEEHSQPTLHLQTSPPTH